MTPSDKMDDSLQFPWQGIEHYFAIAAFLGLGEKDWPKVIKVVSMPKAETHGLLVFSLVLLIILLNIAQSVNVIHFSI